MSNFNKVISLQKIKSKNLGPNQENLVHYLVKDYSFSNDEADILIVDVVKVNAIKSVIFNGKTSYRIVKTNNASDATVLFSDNQGKTPEDITTEDAIILDETDAITTTRDTATNTISIEQEVDGVSALIERKFIDLSDKVEKRLQNIEDHIIGMQLSNLPGSNVHGKAVTENFLHIDILKNRVLELEKQLSEKNTIIDFLTKQLLTLKLYQKINAVIILSKEIALIKKKIVTPYMKNNINSCGLSKSKKVGVLNLPGATSLDILTKIVDVLNKRPTSLVVHVGTSDLTNDINLLSIVKRIINETNKHLPIQFWLFHFLKRQKEFREDSSRYQFLVKKFLSEKKY